MHKVKVKALANRCVMDGPAAMAGVRRYIGREIEGEKPGRILEDGCEVRANREIKRSIRKGDLLAMDRATAEWAGVQFKKATKKKEGTE